LSWINGGEFAYRKIELPNDISTNPEDNARAFNQINFKSLGLNVNNSSRLNPFFYVSYETEFTKEENTPRRMMLSLIPGLTTTWGGIFEEMRIGPDFEMDFSLPDTNIAYGVSFYYLFNKPIIRNNLFFESEMDLRYFPAFETDRTDSLLFTMDIKNGFKIPIISYLYLKPQINLFVFRGKIIEQTGTNLFFGLGITYSRNWKIGTQGFIP